MPRHHRQWRPVVRSVPSPVLPPGPGATAYEVAGTCFFERDEWLRVAVRDGAKPDQCVAMAKIHHRHGMYWLLIASR